MICMYLLVMIFWWKYYIADFYCAQNKIVIELDGSQHFEDEGIAKDVERDEYFRKNVACAIVVVNDKL